MSGLTIYYSDPVQFSKIENSTANFIPNSSNIYKSVIYNGVSYSLKSILFVGNRGADKTAANKGNIYITHQTDSSKNFYLKIELDSKAPNEPSLDSFIRDSTGDSKKEGTINLSALMNTLNGKISSKITVSADKEGNNFMCDLGNLTLLDSAAIVNFNKFNATDSIADIKFTNKNDVLLTVSDAPKKVIQNCKRKRADWGDNDTSENEYIKRTQDSMKISMAFVVVFFVMFFGYIIVHLLNKGDDTDIFGNPLVFDTIMPGMMGGGGRGNKRKSVSVGGGQCYIPDDIPIKFPEPNVLGFGKFAAFLFFLQTIIYGALKKNDEWIGVSIGSLVLLGIVSAGYRIMYNVGFSDGMTISDLLLFSNTFTLAKYPAMLSYLTFYTSFIRNVNKQYTGKHEIAMFTINYILLVVWGIMIVKSKVVSRMNPLFWGPAVLIVILTAIFGGLMGDEEKKKKNQNREDAELANLTQNQRRRRKTKTERMPNWPI